MTIYGNGEHLTDAQFLTLMKIVSDNKPIELEMPVAPGKWALLIREGIAYHIAPDGTYESNPAT